MPARFILFILVCHLFRGDTDARPTDIYEQVRHVVADYEDDSDDKTCFLSRIFEVLSESLRKDALEKGCGHGSGSKGADSLMERPVGQLASPHFDGVQDKEPQGKQQNDPEKTECKECQDAQQQPEIVGQGTPGTSGGTPEDTGHVAEKFQQETPKIPQEILPEGPEPPEAPQTLQQTPEEPKLSKEPPQEISPIFSDESGPKLPSEGLEEASGTSQVPLEAPQQAIAGSGPNTEANSIKKDTDLKSPSSPGSPNIGQENPSIGLTDPPTVGSDASDQVLATPVQPSALTPQMASGVDDPVETTEDKASGAKKELEDGDSKESSKVMMDQLRQMFKSMPIHMVPYDDHEKGGVDYSSYPKFMMHIP